MAFNHYAKLARILSSEPAGWYIQRINEPTSTKKFNGETAHYDHYYRLMRADGAQIPYGKFQQIERLARALQVPTESLPVVE